MTTNKTAKQQQRDCRTTQQHVNKTNNPTTNQKKHDTTINNEMMTTNINTKTTTQKYNTDNKTMVLLSFLYLTNKITPI